jgi:hypothetical protein
MIATLGNKAYVASFVSVLFVPGLALFWHARHVLLRCAWGGALVLMGGVLVLARAETAWLALAAALGTFISIGLERAALGSGPLAHWDHRCHCRGWPMRKFFKVCGCAYGTGPPPG